MKYAGSIRKKLIAIMLLVTSITAFVGYSGFLYSFMNQQHSKALELSKTVALILSQDIAKLVYLNEVAIAADITAKLKFFETVNSMVLYKIDKKAIYQYSKSAEGFIPPPLLLDNENTVSILDDTLDLSMDANYLGTDIGYIQMSFDVETIFDVVQRDMKMLLSSFFVMLMVTYLLAILYSRKFTEPVLTLVSFLSKIDLSGFLKDRITTNEKNEFGQLYSEINIMLDRIESSHEAKKIASAAFETKNAMSIMDSNYKILQVNKSYEEMSGYTAWEIIGQTFSQVDHRIQESLRQDHYWSGEINYIHKNDTNCPFHLTLQTVLDNNENITYYIGSLIDLSEQKATEAKLKHLEEYDGLTGLANKGLLVKHIDNFKKINDKETFGVLLCFDIKNFKMINDAYSHSNGDIILQRITKRLQDSFNNADLISRIGADEFSLWYKSIAATKDRAAVEARILAESLISIFSKHIKLDDTIVNVPVRVGISLFNQDTISGDELLGQADAALHLGKKEEEDIKFYDKQSETMALTHLQTYNELLEAIKKEEFELYYQLQYDNNAQPYAAEALIRWNHPVRGLVSPFGFIEISEKTGLILPISVFVLKQACKQLALWKKDPRTAKWILAINISAQQFNQDDFIEQIKEEVDKNDISYNNLKLELTESILIKDIDAVQTKMQVLKNLGIHISLDDFGTGYSSLQYLRNLPINQLKIDQSFVMNMSSNQIDLAIVKSIVLLADSLGIEVIAEGVEEEEDFKTLQEQGCKFFQGYYFAKPQKIEDIVF